MGKGSNTQTQNSSSTSTMSPDSNAYQAYLGLLDRASGVASTPYQGYTGPQVAGINDQQRAGIGTINQTVANAQPLSQADIDRYQDPYTNQVIDATQRDFDVQNARANSTVLGNAASQGALGGDRSAVAQALMAEQQGRTQDPVIAGLRSQGYQNAVKTAQGQQQFGLQAGLAGGQAQIGAGTLEQQTQQAQYTQDRQDYYQKQGYPFQVAQWLAMIDTGVGSQMGGTSSSTGTAVTEGPKPNPWSQALGLGLTAASMFPFSDRRVKENIERIGETNDGQPIYRFNYKGSPVTTIGLMHDEVEGAHPEAAGEVGGVGVVDYKKATEDAVERFRGGKIAGFAGGGMPAMPWSEGPSWVPQGSISPGKGAPGPAPLPQAPQMKEQSSGLSKDQLKGVGAIGKGLSGVDWGMFTQPNTAAIDNSMGILNSGTGGDFYGPGFAGGGSPSFNERWAGEDPSLPDVVGAQVRDMWDTGRHIAGVLPREQYRPMGHFKDVMTPRHLRAGGGRIRRYANAGFVTDPDLDFEDRFAAARPRTVAGVGASVPAFDDRWSQIRESADMDPVALRTAGMRSLGVVNPEPGDEFRLDPEQYQKTMNRIDRDTGRERDEVAVSQGAPRPVLAFNKDDEMARPEARALALKREDSILPSDAPDVIKTGSSRRAPEAAAEPEDEGSSALGYSGSPRVVRGVAPAPGAAEGAPDESFLGSLGIKMTPELRSGLLQAGLAMMANRRGGPGSFLSSLGEAGMAGVGAHNATVQATQEQAKELRKEQFEREKFEAPFSRKTLAQTESERHNKAIEAKEKYTPGDLYVDKDGNMIPTSREASTGKVLNAITGEYLKPEQGGKFVNSKRNREVNQEEARAVAEYYVKTGDMSRINALGLTSEARQAVQSQIRQAQKELGITDEELATRNVEFAGRKAGQRTLGVMEAKMGSAAIEAEGAIKQARGVIEKLPRTAFLPLNKLLEGYSKNTLNPDQAELYARAQAIVNTYSAVMSRGANITTDSSRQHAHELLSTASDATTFNRVLDTMLQEIDMAKDSPMKMREFYRKMYNRDPGDASKEKKKDETTGGGGATAAPKDTGGFKPPPGAVARQDKSGKTWYFDPTTKQLLPGQ